MGKVKITAVPIADIKQRKKESAATASKPTASASLDANGSGQRNSLSAGNSAKLPSVVSHNPLANIEALQAHLWDAADNLRANSKLTANEYCMPVLGIIFLR